MGTTEPFSIDGAGSASDGAAAGEGTRNWMPKSIGH